MNTTKSYKIRPASGCEAWSKGIAVAAVIAITGANAFAANFTPGNIVVERVGNNTETLSTTGNTIFFDEYTPAGSLVQTITIPDGNGNPGTHPMIEAGTTGTTGGGGMTLSPNGQLLCFSGYATNQGTTNVITTASSVVVPRAVGVLDYTGTYTQVATSTIAYSGGVIRGAFTDGEGNFWGVGTASSSGTNAGVYYFGTDSSAANVSSGNYFGANIVNGSIWYVSVEVSPDAIFQLPGSPTEPATGTVLVPLAFDDSPYVFAVSPDGSTFYDADTGGFSATFSGIHKWTLSGGTWNLDYILLNNGTTGTACFGLTVNWNTPGGPTIYATTSATGNNLISVQDTGSGATATLLATAGTKEIFRGVAFVPTNAPSATGPSIVGIFPSSVSGKVGSSAEISVSATGTAPLSYSWFHVNPANTSTNLIVGAIDSSLFFPSLSAPADDGSYYAVVSNSVSAATSSVVPLTVNDPIIVAEPSSTFGLLDGTVEFSVSALGSSLQYQWYFADSLGNLKGALPASGPIGFGTVSGGTSSTLMISDLQPVDANNDPTNFVVVVTGYSGNTSNSVVVTLGPTPQTLVPNFLDQSTYPVNTNSTIIAFWNFNGAVFSNSADILNPVPYFGVGTATAVGGPYNPGTSPFSTTAFDPSDGADSPFPGGQGLIGGSANGSWGTESYPATGSNKLNGVQFNVSTVGAKNIALAFDERSSSTASRYERVQYTSNGTVWIDYPTSSSTFFGQTSAAWTPGNPLGYSNSFAGFPGVANNPNFGVRIVTEFQSTATYGIGVNGQVTNNYIGSFNNYGTTGTLTYDLITFLGDAITNTYAPPLITVGTTNLTNVDFLPFTNSFVVTPGGTPLNQLTFSVVSLTTNVQIQNNASFTTSGNASSETVTMVVNPYPLSVSSNAGPLLVTVTDTNGDTAVTWFDLTLITQNLPPTNTLTALPSTNTLANVPLSIPFTVGAPNSNSPLSGFTYVIGSGNNTVVPVGNIVVSNQGTIHPTLSITPAHNQLGTAGISVGVDDNNATEPRTTTANISLMVRPNTNIVLIDYFNYDNSGDIDEVSAGLWGHLTGPAGQMQVSAAPTGGSVLVDTLDNTENVQATLLGAPYKTNTSAVLYASFIINMNPNAATGGSPIANGTYFMVYNDGTGVTGDYDGRVIAATNGAAPGHYRLFIDNWGANAADGEAVAFPMDLVPGSNYVVVTEIVLTNGSSTLWINPVGGQSSSSVTDVTTATTAGAINYPISDIELRESGSDAGIVQVSNLKVGTTFDSVYPSLQIQDVGADVVVNWSDPTLSVITATNVLGPWTPLGSGPPYTNTHVSSTNAVFYMFGQ